MLVASERVCWRDAWISPVGGVSRRLEAEWWSEITRVKVYRLNDDGKWDDQGTGHVTVDYLERSEELGLFVIDEEDNDTLLMHRISSDDIYKKQEDTIISWRDPEFSTELALSFQETTGCSYIWDQIFSVQRNLQFSTISNETFHSVNGDIKEWPAVELSSLPSILKNVVESGIADQMRLTELILADQDFFRKLMDLFRICEDLENVDGLHIIFKIVRGIILLNSPQIFEKIFSDELFMDIIGCLEYDPEVPNAQRHRNFLKEHVIFKEAIPIKDPLVLSKIHQTYKIGYLKDVVLAGVLDESTVANLTSIINTNNALVISLLKEDNTFIQELFARLRTPTTLVESKKKLVYFLHEFCGLSKSLQMVHQLRLFRDLMNEGIFVVIADALQSQDKKLVLTGTDVLILFLNQDPSLLRSHVVRQEGIHLFGLLVKGMMTDFGDDMHCQFLEILRSLLDSYTLSGQQRDSIVEVFYENHLAQLIDAITRSCPSEGTSHSIKEVESSVENLNNMKPEILSNICELLCFCVLHHPFRIKCNFLINNVVDKVLLLTQRKEKYLVVAAVRFVRTILSRHDDHLVNHFVKNNLLKPVVDAFVANGNRYNLLNSAVLELFEYIRKENLKALVIYLIDSFWSELVPFEYLAPIQSLKVKYEQCLEDCGPKGTVDVSESRKRIDDRALEKEEEEYFNEDSDEDDTTSHSVTRSQRLQSQTALSNGSAASSQSFSSRSGRLVDYEDDEDDFEYRPPPKKQTIVTDEDDGTMDTLRLKRKIGPKQTEQETAKKQQLGKSSRSKDSLFTSLSTTLSRAALPNKKSVSSTQSNLCTTDGKCEQSNQEKGPAICRSSSDSIAAAEENHREKEPPTSRNCSNVLNNSSDNRQLSGDDHPLIPPQSSPEMIVNGS